jgi:hypothetical protein
MFDCGAYEDEELTELLMRTLKSGWLKVWDIRSFMESGEITTQ